MYNYMHIDTIECCQRNRSKRYIVVDICVGVCSNPPHSHVSGWVGVCSSASDGLCGSYNHHEEKRCVVSVLLENGSAHKDMMMIMTMMSREERDGECIARNKCLCVCLFAYTKNKKD